jgi:hypothetical protein
MPPYIRRPGVTDPGHEYVASSAVKSYEDVPAYKPEGLTAYLNGPHQIKAVVSE